MNGALACAKWIHGSHCRMYCSDQYDIPRGTKQYEYYVCDDSKGTWTPDDFVPDCTGKYHYVETRQQPLCYFFALVITVLNAKRKTIYKS